MTAHQGAMLEWLKRHAWKACVRQKRTAGSNPACSAKTRQETAMFLDVFFYIRHNGVSCESRLKC